MLIVVATSAGAAVDARSREAALELVREEMFCGMHQLGTSH
jgi:hypothetical protein